MGPNRPYVAMPSLDDFADSEDVSEELREGRMPLGVVMPDGKLPLGIASPVTQPADPRAADANPGPGPLDGSVLRLVEVIAEAWGRGEAFSVEALLERYHEV